MAKCPNKSHPDWIELVSKVGETEAYKLWLENGEEIPDLANVKVNGSAIRYQLKAVNIFLNPTDKVTQEFNKLNKESITIEQFVTNIQIPKEQKKLVIDSYNKGRKTLEELALDLIYNYSYLVEVVTTVTKVDKGLYERESFPTDFYRDITVPGGVNYTENEIRTPEITPSIKGHAQFATNRGIGWFRADEQVSNKPGIDSAYAEGSKIQRILEIQSDLFQKGREETNLTKKKSEFTSSNKFLQLLNKDNNWVTFFIRSIIQNTARNGYEKVLFPKGNTASKVEGHETVQGFINQTQARIDVLQTDINRGVIVNEQGFFQATEEGGQFETEKEAQKVVDFINIQRRDEITQLKEELRRVEVEGIGALKPIFNFYQNIVTNILKKTYKNAVKEIIDSYGNTWNEVDLSLIDNSDITLDDIPLQNSIEKVEDIYQDIVIPGFTAYLQDETVSHIMEQVLATIRDTPGTSFNKAISEFVNLAEDEVENGNLKYEPIIENIDRFRSLVKDRLDRIGLIERTSVDPLAKAVYGPDNQPDSSPDVGGDKANDGFYWADDWVFKFDAKANAQKATKQFLTFIPKTVYENKEYKDVKNYLDTFSFMSYDEVFEDLRAILADVPNNWESMKSTLVQYQQTKPWIYNLLYQVDNYSGDKTQLIHQFVSTFSSSYNSFKTLLWNRERGQFTFKVIDTDQASVINTLLSKWQNNFNTTDLYIQNEEGDLIPNEKVVATKVEELDKLETNPQNVRKFLDSIGVTISKETEEELVKGNVYGLTFAQHFKSVRGLFVLIKSRLKGNDNDGLEVEEIINPVINNSAIRSLAYTENKYNNTLYSNSTRNGEGNTVYSYSYNKYFTYQFQRLQDKAYIEQLSKLTFHSPILEAGKPIYNTWLYELANNQQFKEIFEISPFDTIKRSSRDGITLSNMTDVDLELTKWQSFQNKGRYVKGLGNVSNYLFTIPSKTTSYMVTAPRLPMNISFTGNEYKFGKQIRDSLYSIALTELNRINNSFGRKITSTKYKNGSKNFYFFPILNKETSPEIWNSDGTVKLPTTKIGSITVETIIRNKVEKIIKDEITNKLAYWADIGFIQDGKLTYIDKTYANSLKLKADSNNIIAAADYIINNTLFEFNMQQSFIGDPAVYYKNSVQDTWDELGKRLAAQIAPGKDLSLTSRNEKFISVKVQDREGNIALNIAQLQSRLNKEADPYLKLNGTDAQEFTTLNEHLYVLYRSGLIDSETYRRIKTKGEKLGVNLILTEKELGTVFQPIKPVYVNSNIDTTQDLLDVDYIKSSSVPLLPQFTKGLAIDKLRTSMEKLERARGYTVRLAFNSATKVGTIKSDNIFTENGDIKDDLDLSNSYKLLPREGFRIQQDVPYDPTYKEVVKSSQITKILFDSILAINDFNFEGKSYTGKELKDVWNDLHKQLFELSKEDLNKDLLDSNGKLNMKKVQAMLEKEAILREYSPAEIASLSMLPDQTFEFPFWAVNSSRKFEALLTSLYTNNIIKQKMHGNSYILVSEEAIRGKSSGVVYTKNYDPKTGLQPMRIGEDGKVLPAQVLMPWRLSESITEYITDGYLDTNKVPQELLEQFGFRIPAQGHQSMSLIEIVGFIPEVMGDAIIASRNFITQMGSDFDVDKLFIYDYFTVKEGNKLVKEQPFTFGGFESKAVNSLKNQILDIHKAVLSHPDVYNSVVTPLGNLKDTETGKELKKRYKQTVTNYLSPDYKKQKYSESVDGKVMIGISALSNTLNTTIQEYNLYVINEDEEKVYITWGDDNGKKRLFNDLSSPFTWRGKSKNKMFANRLSAAVDNEKDPILYYMNVNSITAPFIAGMEQLGLEEDHTYNVTAQPIIREYVRRVKNNRSVVSIASRGVEDVQLHQIINETRKAYLKTLSEVEAGKYTDFEMLQDAPTVKELKANMNKSSLEMDLILLLKFQQVYDIGKSLAQVQSAVNLESSGVGKSVLEVALKSGNVNRIYKIKNIANVSRILEGYSGIVVNIGLGSAQETLGDPNNPLFKYNSRSFKKILKDYELTTSNITTVEQTEDLWDNYKSYLFAKGVGVEKRSSLFLGKNTLALRVKEFLKTEQGRTNPFLLRLNFDTMTNLHLVSYNASKEEYVDEVNIYRGFVELLSSKDPKTKELGEDLVTYFYINGGIQKAREWGKYIHPGYLKTYKGGEFLSFLRTYDFQGLDNLGETSPINNYLIQYFQHKPWYLPTIDLKSKDWERNQDRTFLKLPSLLKTTESFPVSLTEEGEYPAMVTIEDKNASKGYEIYIKAIQDEEGTLYARLSALGTTTSFNEYSPNSRASSLVNTNFTSKVNSKAPIKNKPIDDTKSVPAQPEPKAKTINEVLDSITDEKWKPLINLLKTKQYKGIVTVKELTGFRSGTYHYDTGNIDIQKDTNNYERVVLHEVVHAATVDALQNTATLTSEQLKAVNSLKTIADSIRRQVLNGELTSIGLTADELNEFDSLNKQRKSGTLTETQIKRATELRKSYYGISSKLDGTISYEEFLAEFLTNPHFQEKLNNIKYDSKRSFLDRLIELLTGILNVLGVKSDTALEAAIRDVVIVIADKPEVKKSKHSLIDKKRTEENTTFDTIADTLDSDYKGILERYEGRFKFIDQSIATAITEKDYIRAEKLKARRAEIEKEFKTFEDNQVFSTLLALGQKDLDTVERILGQANLSHNDINYTLRVIKTWEESPDLVLTKEDITDINQRAKDISQLAAQASLLYQKWETVAKNALLQSIKAATGLEKLTEDVLNAQEKVNALTANLMDISRTGNLILSVMDKWMREANYKANIEAKEVHEETLSLVKNLQNNELFKKDGYYVFAQTNKDGELTGELVRPLDPNYYETRNKLLEKASHETAKPKRAQYWKDYFNWIRENHAFIDIRKVFTQDNEGKYQYKPNEDYLSGLRKTLGLKFDELLEEQKQKMLYYNENLENKILSLDKEDTNYFREIEKWKVGNDPTIYLRNVLDGKYTTTTVGGDFIKNEGHEYVIKRAYKKWEDIRYNKIQNSAELKAFYDHAVKNLNRLYSVIPAGFKNGITSYTIPSVGKSITETYNEKGMNAALSQANNNMIEGLSVDEVAAQTRKIQDPITKKPQLSLNVRYLNTLSPEERSYDLGKVINVFALEVLNYKHKSIVEDSIRLSQSILEQSLEVVRNPSGTAMIDRFGKPLTIKDGKNLQDQMEYAISAFYGYRKELQGVSTKKVYKNKANSKNKALTQAITDKKFSPEVLKFVSTDLKLPEIAFEFSKGTLSEENIQKVKIASDRFLAKNTRYITGSKVGDQLLKYMQLKGMGWNIFSSITNVTFGWFSNFIHSNAGVDFNNTQLLKANKYMLSATGRGVGVNSKLGKKINSLMVKFDVLKELNDAAYHATTNTNRVRQGMDHLSPFELQRRGEYYVQGMTMLATMFNTNVTLSTGETINLFDAFNDSGEFIEDNKDWKGSVDDKESNKELYKFKFKLDQINKSIHGNYDPNSPVRIKSGILGRATMQFRSWIAEGVANRIEGQKYDLLLGRERKGRWRTYGDLGFINSFRTLLRVASRKEVNLSNLSKEDLKLVTENMKKNLAEIYQSLFLLAIYFALKQIELDDDDEWGKRSANFTINQILRLQDDIEFYYSPLAVENITQNFIPVFTLVRDAWKFKDALEIGVVDGEWEYKTGKKAGENRILWTGAKIFPFGSSMASFLNKTETEEGFRK